MFRVLGYSQLGQGQDCQWGRSEGVVHIGIFSMHTGRSGPVPAWALRLRGAGSPWGAHYASRDPKFAGRGGRGFQEWRAILVSLR